MQALAMYQNGPTGAEQEQSDLLDFVQGHAATMAHLMRCIDLYRKSEGAASREQSWQLHKLLDSIESAAETRRTDPTLRLEGRAFSALRKAHLVEVTSNQAGTREFNALKKQLRKKGQKGQKVEKGESAVDDPRRELDKALRIMVVRRSQVRLHDYLKKLWLQPGQYDTDCIRDLFINFCHDQIHWNRDDANEELLIKQSLLLAYHLEFGSQWTLPVLLEHNLFPSLTRKKDADWWVKQQLIPQSTEQAQPATMGTEPLQIGNHLATVRTQELQHVPLPVAAPGYGGGGGLALDLQADFAGQQAFTNNTEDDQPYTADDDTTVAHDNQSHLDTDDEDFPAERAKMLNAFGPQPKKVLVIMEMMGAEAIAFRDERGGIISRNSCRVDDDSVLPAVKCQLHYRLAQVLRYLLTHERCVLCVTFCNPKDDERGPILLRHLLEDLFGQKWQWHGEAASRRLSHPKLGNVFVLTHLRDDITVDRPAEGKHRYLKHLFKIVGLVNPIAGYVFSEHNAVALDASENNWDPSSIVARLPQWNQGWGFKNQEGSEESPPLLATDDSEERLLQFFKRVLDDDKHSDVRGYIEEYMKAETTD
eukprot:TRINITY_DN9239_c0_g1_i2.p1 TRINITY_DN9239_c0_g1~~TRINITY_DN9239_c0_g1_i2.p1  ORF type:complete len:591 (-),score=118.39 TRINITY_DN9239_c0_g1_i2:142-1914(-)